MERVEGLVIVGQDFRVVKRGSPETDAFIIRHEDFPNKELYATKRIVHITLEVPKKKKSIWRDLPLTNP